MTQKVIKTGNSLAITIPTKFAKALAIKKGDEVRVQKRPDRGTLTFFFQGAHQLAILDMFEFSKSKRIPAHRNAGSHKQKT